MADLTGIVTGGSPPLPTDGVTVKLWHPADMTVPSTLPAYDGAEPAASPVATCATGPGNGATGAFAFTGVAAGLYFLSFTIFGHIYWWAAEATLDPAGVLHLTATGSALVVDHDAAISGNLLLGAAADAASGVGVLALGNRTTAPTTSPTLGGVLYIEGGALKYKGSAGSVTTLAPA